MLVRHGESTWIAEGRFQGRENPPLSPLGERQASLVGERLAAPLAAPPLPLPGRPPLGVWHSPLTRAHRTAEAIADRIGDVALYEAPAFTEIGQGTWQGRRHEEIVAEDGAALEAWRREPVRYHAPGGEPLLEAASRVQQGLRELLAALLAEGPAEAPGPSAALGSRVAPPAGAAGRAALDDRALAARVSDDPDAASPNRASAVPGYAVPADEEPWAILVAHDGIFRLILLTLLELPYERFWSFPFVLCGVSIVAVRDGHAVLRAHNLSDHLATLAAGGGAAAAEAKGDRRGAL